MTVFAALSFAIFGSAAQQTNPCCHIANLLGTPVFTVNDVIVSFVVIYRTTEAPPITYPANLGGGGGKVGTVNITWDPMPVSEWNAGMSSVGYIVSWKKVGMSDEQWDSVSVLLSVVDLIAVNAIEDLFMYKPKCGRCPKMYSYEISLLKGN